MDDVIKTTAVGEDKQEFTLGEEFSLPYILRTNERELKREFESYKMKKMLSLVTSAVYSPDMPSADIRSRLSDAKEHGFYAVSVQPESVWRVKKLLKKTNVKVATVISFPFGEDSLAVKVYAVKQAVKRGADEIDCVAATSAIKRGDYRYVRREMRKIARAGKKRARIVIESRLLKSEELERTVALAAAVGIDVRLGTGYFGAARKEEIDSAKKLLSAKKLRLFVSGARNFEDVLSAMTAGADMIVTAQAKDVAVGFENYFK